MAEMEDYGTGRPGRHECPWPPCGKLIARHMLACAEHWYMLPKDIRSRIWAAYRNSGPGSIPHMLAIGEAIEWYERQA